MGRQDVFMQVDEAQVKLADLNSAINRDQLIAEQKTKELKDLDKQLESVQKQIDSLNEGKETLEVTFNGIQSNNKSTIEMMKREAEKLQADIIELTSEKVAAQNSLEAATALAAENEKKLEQHFELVRGQLAKDAQLIVDQISKEQEAMSKTLQEHKELIFRGTQLQNVIDSNQKKIDEQTPLLGEVLANQTKLDGLAYDIAGKKGTLLALNEQVDEAGSELLQTQLDIKTVMAELEVLKSERDDFNKQKLILAEQQQALTQKEEKMKDVFERAGIQF